MKEDNIAVGQEKDDKNTELVEDTGCVGCNRDCGATPPAKGKSADVESPMAATMTNHHDIAGRTMEMGSPAPRGIFKVPRGNREGRMREVLANVGNLETATVGGDAPPVATLVDDVEVLEYAEAVPVDDMTDVQAELEKIRHRNILLKRTLGIALFFIAIIVIAVVVVLLLDEDSDEQCEKTSPILCLMSEQEQMNGGSPDNERKYCRDNYCECNKNDSGRKYPEGCDPKQGAIPCAISGVFDSYDDLPECAHNDYAPLDEYGISICSQSLDMYPDCRNDRAYV